jgi:SAM-dependent methyltransferase
VKQTGYGSFDELADDYQRFRIGYADEIYDLLREHAVGAGSRVLDLGCGTGLVSARLVAAGCIVTGADPSEPMLAHARLRVPGAAFVAATAEKLPFEGNSFDAATCAQAFHWFDQRRALEELQRVVRPGGTIAVWWKGLMRGDPIRHVREDIARELGCEPPRDLLAQGFPGFADAPLEDKRLRVVPWLTQMRVADYLGYERSRARARDAFGRQRGAYLDRLAQRLGDPESTLSLNYLHYLYLARVPGAGGTV